MKTPNILNHVNGFITWFTTGVSGKTSWDWLEVAGVPLAVALFGLLGVTYSLVSQHFYESVYEATQIKINMELRQQEKVDKYIEQTTEIIIASEQKLKGNSLASRILQARTLATFKSLDNAQLKGKIIYFLWSARLIQCREEESSSICLELKNADLKSLSAYGFRLTDINLHATDLRKAVLSKADLSNANLSYADLRKAKLNDTKIKEANIKGTKLMGVKDLKNEQIKSACNWRYAIYKDGTDANRNFIKELEKEVLSDPKVSIDCSRWKTR